jgi:hypothetical protein
MSDWMELRLEHKQPALDGLLTFDGQVVEAFGFNDVRSVRMPVRLLEKVTVSFKSGLIAQPNITFEGRNGGLGFIQPIEVSDERRPEIEAFADAVNAAIRNGA